MKRVVCLQTMGQNDQNQNVETLYCSWRYKILTQLPENNETVQQYQTQFHQNDADRSV